MERMKRTATCGELRAVDAGRHVVLNGWVHRHRDHGGVRFVDVRDRYGLTQVVVDADASDELRGLAQDLKFEYCIAVEGEVRARPSAMANPRMPTGEIEVRAASSEILSTCETLPFMIDERADAKEDSRLRWRYLDLRTFSMQRKIELRHKAAFATREYLVGRGFYEIDTPLFIRSTIFSGREGGRNGKRRRSQIAQISQMKARRAKSG